jgi:hypothetical protein
LHLSTRIAPDPIFYSLEEHYPPMKHRQRLMVITNGAVGQDLIGRAESHTENPIQKLPRKARTLDEIDLPQHRRWRRAFLQGHRRAPGHCRSSQAQDDGQQPDAAMELVKCLALPSSMPVIKNNGMDPA